MLPSYNLMVDITATEKNLEEIPFRVQVAPCLAYLEALKGAFDRVPCKTTYYPPFEENSKSEYWRVRAVVMISVGEKRGSHLVSLYEAVARLVELELSDCQVWYEISRFDFS